MEQRFSIGDRVKVRVATDVIPEDEVNCGVGVVYGAILQFPSSPEHHKMRYKILLDAPYGKVIYKRVHIEFTEGFNVDETKQSIELVELKEDTP